RHEFILTLYLGDSKTAARLVGFYKTGQSHLFNDLLYIDIITLVQEIIFCGPDAIRLQHADEVSFIESKCSLVEIAGGLGNVQQFQVGLQQAVLSGGSVDDIEYAVETDLFSVDSCSKIASVHG